MYGSHITKVISSMLVLFSMLYSQSAYSVLFTFSQAGFEDDAVITGSFTGVDLNNDGILTLRTDSIETGEISLFNMSFSGNSITPAFDASFPFPVRSQPGPPTGFFSNFIYNLNGGPLGDDSEEGILFIVTPNPLPDFNDDIDFRYSTGSALFDNCGTGGGCGNIAINNQLSTQSNTNEFVQINTVPVPATIWLVMAAMLGFISLKVDNKLIFK